MKLNVKNKGLTPFDSSSRFPRTGSGTMDRAGALFKTTVYKPELKDEEKNIHWYLWLIDVLFKLELQERQGYILKVIVNWLDTTPLCFPQLFSLGEGQIVVCLLY